MKKINEEIERLKSQVVDMLKVQDVITLEEFAKKAGISIEISVKVLESVKKRGDIWRTKKYSNKYYKNELLSRCSDCGGRVNWNNEERQFMCDDCGYIHILYSRYKQKD